MSEDAAAALRIRVAAGLPEHIAGPARDVLAELDRLRAVEAAARSLLTAVSQVGLTPGPGTVSAVIDAETELRERLRDVGWQPSPGVAIEPIAEEGM